MKGVPLSPAEVEAERADTTAPSEVFDIINMMLVETKPTKGCIVLHVKDIRKNVLERMNNFMGEWLDFEDAYNKMGWFVDYEEDRFTFTPKIEVPNKRSRQ